MTALSRHRPIVAMLAIALVFAVGETPTASSQSRTIEQMARALGTDVVERLARGYVPRRSGDILLVPEPWNVLGQWSGGLRGAGDPRTTHASPWAHHQRVPIVFFGPGYIRSGVGSERSVDVADLAPTFAELLGFSFDSPDGAPLMEALRDDRRRPPRVIVLVAYDGGGWNVLEQWPGAWPVERRLAQRGTVFLNATAGSSPSVTAPVHATMGTGAYPRKHGIPENTARLPDGTVDEIFFHRADPRLLTGPTIADAWDAANDNRPWVGLLGFESWHLGMMGKGTLAAGGDRDAALLWARDDFRYWTNPDVYRLVPDLPGRSALDAHLRDLDARDGARDGSWRDNDLMTGSTFILAATPAFVDMQADAARDLLSREPIGRDRLTDFLFIELKSTDYAGHVFNMVSPEVGAVIKAQDRLLGELVRSLNREVGPGRWVLALTADHGQSPTPEAVGGLRIDRGRLMDDINGHFGLPVVEAVHPSELYLDEAVLRAAGITVEEVARYVGEYRFGDGLPPGTRTEGISPSLLDRRVFAAALPGDYVEGLTPADLAALGPGSYAEGDLTTPPHLEVLGDPPRR